MIDLQRAGLLAGYRCSVGCNGAGGLPSTNGMNVHYVHPFAVEAICVISKNLNVRDGGF